MRGYERPNALVLIIIGFILSVIVWRTGLTYINLVSQTKAPVTVNNNEHLLVLSDFDFWTCQVGVFREKENAELEKERFVQMGWQAEIFTTNPYAVGIGLAHKEGELDNLHEELKKKGIENITKQVFVPEKSYKVKGTEGVDEAKEFLLAVNNLLKEGLSSNNLVKIISISPENGNFSEMNNLSQEILSLSKKVSDEERTNYGLRIFTQYQKLIEFLTQKN